MANEEQLAILKQGVDVWNAWRENNRTERIDLRRAYLHGAELDGVDLRDADLQQINLGEAHLSGANFEGAYLTSAFLLYADLRHAHFRRAHLRVTNFGGANLDDADLREADLDEADLSETTLRNADLRDANLTRTVMIGTQFENAKLSNCRIYGISAWNVELAGAIQSNLIITDYDEPEITVDNLEVAQFIYLLIHNEKLRDVIDTVGKKAVLILGRFTDERKAVLDAIREELRQRDYIPILFDFEKPSSRDVTETVSTLAHMARFVIADLTDAKSIPQELAQIVPHLPSVAVQPLIVQGQREYGMFEHWTRYGWVLPIHVYENQAGLIAELGEKVIVPAEAKVSALRQVR